MKNQFIRRLVLCILCLMLLAATAFLAVGCNKTDAPKGEAQTDAPVKADEPEKLAFTFKVTKSDGTEKTIEIKTDKKTVGEALLDEGLIAGDEGEYGLYVKTVDGETLDWDADQMYWAFYINGEYAMTGVDATPAEAGATYSFIATKG